jgi:hypothetical protein
LNTNSTKFTKTCLAAVAVAVIVPMLLLSVSLASPVQIAKGQEKKDAKINATQLAQAKKINIKQVNHQETQCKNVDCPTNAVNAICLPGAVCHFGRAGVDENPLIISTPH